MPGIVLDGCLYSKTEITAKSFITFITSFADNCFFDIAAKIDFKKSFYLFSLSLSFSISLSFFLYLSHSLILSFSHSLILSFSHSLILSFFFMLSVMVPGMHFLMTGKKSFFHVKFSGLGPLI